MITKKNLDTLMQEYDYEKNDMEDTLDFLSFMFTMYSQVKEKKNGC